MNDARLQMHAPITRYATRRPRATVVVGGGTGTLLCGILVAALLAVAPAATPSLDQAQTAIQGGLSLRVAAWQTITIGRSGNIGRVDLPLCTPKRGTGIALTLSRGAGPQRSSIGATVSFGRTTSDCTWQTLRLSRPFPVRRGQVVRLTVVGRGTAAPLWGANLYGGDPYRPGTGHWMGRTIDDFGFRIYVAATRSTTSPGEPDSPQL
jgi:hypothetical protein